MEFVKEDCGVNVKKSSEKLEKLEEQFRRIGFALNDTIATTVAQRIEIQKQKKLKNRLMNQNIKLRLALKTLNNKYKNIRLCNIRN